MAIELTWHGHSCFSLTYNGYTVVIDPYRADMFPWLKELSVRANDVLCTHGHDDHAWLSAVTLVAGGTNPFTVEKIDCAHDDCGGKKRGRNNMLLLRAGGLSIAHLGDIGCALNEEQIQKLTGVDLLLIPVGGFYTIDGEQAAGLAKLLQPKAVIPMHYCPEGNWESVITTVEPFLRCFDAVTELPTRTLVLDGSQRGVYHFPD